MEFAPFVDVFGWARNDFNYDIEVVTCGFTKVVTSTFGIPVTVDKTFDEICADDYDALAIPGGFENYGFYEDAFDKRFLDLIAEFDRQGKYIASIWLQRPTPPRSGFTRWPGTFSKPRPSFPVCPI